MEGRKIGYKYKCRIQSEEMIQTKRTLNFLNEWIGNTRNCVKERNKGEIRK